MITLLYWSCTTNPDPLAPWPSDPAETLQRCAAEQVDELKITCHVQAAAQFAQRKHPEKAEEVCVAISNPIWKSECFFRVGEELAVAGNLNLGLRFCSEAKQFSRSCMTHAIWRPRTTELRQGQAFTSNWLELEAQLQPIAESFATPLPGEVIANSLAAAGLFAYVGSGKADPGCAQESGIIGAACRSGYAFEWVRLMHNAGLSVDFKQMWEDVVSRRVRTGAPNRDALREGVHSPAPPPGFEPDVLRIHLYGGGQRLTTQNAQDDLRIAHLEAVLWVDASHSIPPQLHQHPNRSVRQSAQRLMSTQVRSGKDDADLDQ